MAMLHFFSQTGHEESAFGRDLFCQVTAPSFDPIRSLSRKAGFPKPPGTVSVKNPWPPPVKAKVTGFFLKHPVIPLDSNRLKL